jgi:hypothetical protein
MGNPFLLIVIIKLSVGYIEVGAVYEPVEMYITNPDAYVLILEEL